MTRKAVKCEKSERIAESRNRVQNSGKQKKHLSFMNCCFTLERNSDLSHKDGLLWERPLGKIVNSVMLFSLFELRSILVATCL